MGMKTGFARTCAGAQGRLQVLTPAEDCGIQHRIDHRKRGVVVQAKTVAVALAASVLTLLWLVIAVHWRSRPSISRIRPALRRGKPSQRGGVLTLRSRCFGVSRLPSAARLRPEQW